MKNKKDFEASRKVLESKILKRYKGEIWKDILSGIGTFFIGIFLLYCILQIVWMVFYLIRNPISLGIICITILLVLKLNRFKIFCGEKK